MADPCAPLSGVSQPSREGVSDLEGLSKVENPQSESWETDSSLVRAFKINYLGLFTVFLNQVDQNISDLISLNANTQNENTIETTKTLFLKDVQRENLQNVDE